MHSAQLTSKFHSRFLFIFVALCAFAFSAEAQTTLTFSVKVGSPATAYPAYPYTAISEYFSTTSTISVVCSNPSADIRYTTDGTPPTLASTSIANNGTIVLAKKFTLSAKAFVSGVEVATAQENFHATGMIAAGADHALALPATGGVASGSVWTWGENGTRQLGYGSSVTDSPTKAAVKDELGAFLSGVKALAGGSNFSLALLNDGTMKAWGGGASTTANQGQLGNNSSAHTAVVAENYLVTVRDSTGASGTHLSGVVGIAAGALHSLAITSDGTPTGTGKVWAWGNGASYQIGNNATSVADRLCPAAVLKTGTLTQLTDAVEVAGGLSHSAALTSSGEVYTWGLNSSGQVLGTSATTTPIKTATLVNSFGTTGNPATAFTLTCGDNFTLVVRSSDRTIWGWGLNSTGQLGDNSITSPRRAPRQVVKLSDGLPLDNVAMVSAGQLHALALRTDGTVWAWGDNALGKLGDGTILDRHAAVPITIPGTPTPFIVAVAAGGDFSMALAEDGRIFTWGNPASGRLGDSTMTGSHYSPANPTYTPNLINHAPYATISAFFSNPSVQIQPATASLMVNFGDGDGDLLQAATYVDGVLYSTSPAYQTFTVPGLAVGTHSFSVSAVDSAGLTATSAVNYLTVTPPTVSVTAQVPSTSEVPSSNPGKLRVAITPTQLWPVTVNYTMSGLAENGIDYTALSGAVVIPTSPAYADVSIVPLADGLAEWQETATMTLSPNSGYLVGSNSQATVTITDDPPVATPTIYPDPSTKTKVDVVQISCLTPSAKICYTTDGSDPVATLNPTTTGPVNVRVASGMTLKAKAFSTGMPASGQVGGIFSGKAYAVAGYDCSFAVLSDGTAWAWGDNTDGRLGLGTPVASFNLPQPLAAFDNAKSISSSSGFTAAVLSNGTFAACGTFSPSFGDGLTTSSTVPVSVSGLTNATATSVGQYHVVVVKADGTAWAWGSNSHGQLGNGTTNDATTPVQIMKSVGVPFEHVVSVLAGDDFTALLTDDNKVSVCGYYVRLGSTATADSAFPATIPTLSNIVSIGFGWLGVQAVGANAIPYQWGEAAGAPGIGMISSTLSLNSGSQFSTILTGYGVIYTWGKSPYGELGNGDTAPTNYAAALGLPLLTTQISARSHHCLAIQDDGREAIFWSWGKNGAGQLGIGNSGDQSIPWPVSFSYPQATGDTNGDGLSDWDDFRFGLSPVDLDLDHDGISNADELLLGTSPFSADTDGDGHPDNTDAFPLDPTRWLNLGPDPNDHTWPTITLDTPFGATLQ